MGMGWEWEYGHRNEREWDRKSHSRTSLVLSLLLRMLYYLILISLRPIVSNFVNVPL